MEAWPGGAITPTASQSLPRARIAAHGTGQEQEKPTTSPTHFGKMVGILRYHASSSVEVCQLAVPTRTIPWFDPLSNCHADGQTRLPATMRDRMIDAAC